MAGADPTTAIMNLAGGAIGSGVNFFSQMATNEANKQLYYEMREWDKPVNQVARMREANLNPNLVYGHGTVANTSPHAPSLQAPQMEKLDILDSVARTQQIKNLETQNEYNNEMVRQARANANVAERDFRVLTSYDETPVGRMIRSTDAFPLRVAGAGAKGFKEALKQFDKEINPSLEEDLKKGYEGRNYRGGNEAR